MRLILGDCLDVLKTLEPDSVDASRSGGAMPELCANCDGEGWVCENHPEVPFNGGDKTCCGGAGMPCSCNKANPPWHFVPEREKPNA